MVVQWLPLSPHNKKGHGFEPASGMKMWRLHVLPLLVDSSHKDMHVKLIVDSKLPCEWLSASPC